MHVMPKDTSLLRTELGVNVFGLWKHNFWWNISCTQSQIMVKKVPKFFGTEFRTELFCRTGVLILEGDYCILIGDIKLFQELWYHNDQWSWAMMTYHFSKRLASPLRQWFIHAMSVTSSTGSISHKYLWQLPVRSAALLAIKSITQGSSLDIESHGEDLWFPYHVMKHYSFTLETIRIKHLPFYSWTRTL